MTLPHLSISFTLLLFQCLLDHVISFVSVFFGIIMSKQLLVSVTLQANCVATCTWADGDSDTE